MKLASKPLPHGKQTVTPYMIVKGAAQFIDFLKEAFDAHEFGRALNPDGNIGHAEVQVGNSTLMIADGKEEWRDTPCFLSIYIDDADEVFQQALKAGAIEPGEYAIRLAIFGGFRPIFEMSRRRKRMSYFKTLKRWQSCITCRKHLYKKWTGICYSGNPLFSYV